MSCDLFLNVSLSIGSHLVKEVALLFQIHTGSFDLANLISRVGLGLLLLIFFFCNCMRPQICVFVLNFNTFCERISFFLCSCLNKGYWFFWRSLVSIEHATDAHLCLLNGLDGQSVVIDIINFTLHHSPLFLLDVLSVRRFELVGVVTFVQECLAVRVQCGLIEILIVVDVRIISIKVIVVSKFLRQF